MRVMVWVWVWVKVRVRARVMVRARVSAANSAALHGHPRYAHKSRIHWIYKMLLGLELG